MYLIRYLLPPSLTPIRTFSWPHPVIATAPYPHFWSSFYFSHTIAKCVSERIKLLSLSTPPSSSSSLSATVGNTLWTLSLSVSQSVSRKCENWDFNYRPSVQCRWRFAGGSFNDNFIAISVRTPERFQFTVTWLEKLSVHLLQQFASSAEPTNSSREWHLKGNTNTCSIPAGVHG